MSHDVILKQIADYIAQIKLSEAARILKDIPDIKVKDAITAYKKHHPDDDNDSSWGDIQGGWYTYLAHELKELLDSIDDSVGPN